MSNLGKSLSQLALRWRFTAFDQYATIYKSPANSKIVLYGAYNQLFTSLLDKQFQNFSLVDPTEAASEHSETIHDTVDAVAHNLVRIDENFNDGCYIRDYPTTVDEATRLDQLLDGINLAVNITVPESSADKLSGKFLECKNCGHLYNTGLEATYPSHPGSVDACCSKPDIAETTRDITSPSNYGSNYQPVFDYYTKRGLLLNFEVDEKWTLEETAKRLRDEILANIKL